MHVTWNKLMLLCVVLCRYVDAVKPGRYGVPKPFYFPFLPSYWTGKTRNVCVVIMYSVYIHVYSLYMCMYIHCLYMCMYIHCLYMCMYIRMCMYIHCLYMCTYRSHCLYMCTYRSHMSIHVYVVLIEVIRRCGEFRMA